MSRLFDPITIRGVTFSNRIGLSPMCMYSCERQDGVATEWHRAHLGSRAVGGCGLVMTEATSVSPEGRISPEDLGVWNDAQAEALAPIVAFIKSRGAVAGIQLAHAGRKAGTYRPWSTLRGWIPNAEGGWTPVAPSAVAFQDGAPVPRELTVSEIKAVIDDFCAAAVRSLLAGFQVVELHSAHGYLLHEFLSPLSNFRTDEYGGDFENRTRFHRELVTNIRRVWPTHLPLFMRISATDWVDEGWSIEDSVRLAEMMKPLGVDVFDCSSGGAVANAQVPVGPGYQVGFAERVKSETGLATAAVGLILDSGQANEIVEKERADFVFLGRLLLREPYWPLRAATELGVAVAWPSQYARAIG